MVVVVGAVGAEEPPLGVVAGADDDSEWDGAAEFVPGTNAPAVLDPFNTFGDPPPTTLPAETGVLVFTAPQPMVLKPTLDGLCTLGRIAETELPAPPKIIPIPRLTMPPAIITAVPR
ncbi:MAG: hypothetical protein ACRDWB_06175 [Acidimicrobiales bacterium]